MPCAYHIILVVVSVAKPTREAKAQILLGDIVCDRRSTGRMIVSFVESSSEVRDRPLDTSSPTVEYLCVPSAEGGANELQLTTSPTAKRPTIPYLPQPSPAIPSHPQPAQRPPPASHLSPQSW